MKKRHLLWAVLLTGTGLLFAAVAHADESGTLGRLIGLNTQTTAALPAQVESNPDIIRLTPDKTKIITLEQDATSVVVANPAHAGVLLDSPRVLVIMPRQPGSTSFTVLNAKGEAILQKDIIVTAAQPQYVRVRRMCGAEDKACQESSYFYCPDGCYEVSPVQPPSDNQKTPEIAGGGASAFDGSADGDEDPQRREEFENGEIGDGAFEAPAGDAE